MDLRESPEQQELRKELRAYFAALLPEEKRRAAGEQGVGGEYFREIVKLLGKDGWLGIGWPKEFGGQGRSIEEQFVFFDEVQRAGLPFPFVTVNTVGPTLMKYGTEEQKERFLPGILAGDIVFAIGYTEPEAGTDLASLKTRAVLDGDEWIVDGNKIFTSGANTADYVWLACRTDADAPKHKGISILIVDTTDPGFSWTPIITADGSHHVNATYFNDVRVPADMLVGEENKGWKLITTQLNHERVMLGPAGRIEGLRDRVLHWVQSQGITDSPDVRALIGKTTAVFRVNELLNWAVAKAGEAGEIEVADASSSKVFAADQVQHLLADLIALVHRHGDPGDPATKSLLDYLDAQAKRNLVLTFGGGVQEVQRELIAMFGLGMPRVPR